MSKLSISNIDSIEKPMIGNQGSFEAGVGRFSDLFGMKGMGCSVVELAPGKKAWPYHLHYGQEEMFLVLKGSGVVRYDDELYPLKTGDIFYTPPGEGTAHQIINNSETTLQYLALSTKESPEVCFYPDSGKYGSYFPKSDQERGAFIANEENNTDYFNGEE